MKENGKLAVDTNAVIAYREGIPVVCNLIEKAETIFLPVVVLGELFYGAINSSRPKENEQAVHKFLAQSVLVVIDEAIAGRYAAIRLKLKKAGHPIPENDLWVAAACLEFDIPLLSRDTHFNYIHDFKVINWTKTKEHLGTK